MRYTTIIDISDKSLYKNVAARLVYLHLALKAGWHDDDRDLVEISIRTLAMQVGITISATRHALQQLTTANLIVKQGGSMWFVRKWMAEQSVTPRVANKRQQQQIERAAERARENERREREAAIEQLRRDELTRSGKTSFMLWYESQQQKAAAGDPDAARAIKMHAATYEAHRQNIASKNAINQA